MQGSSPSTISKMRSRARLGDAAQGVLEWPEYLWTHADSFPDSGCGQEGATQGSLHPPPQVPASVSHGSPHLSQETSWMWAQMSSQPCDG